MSASPTAPIAPVATDVSASPDDVHVEPSGASLVAKVEAQTPKPSPRSWQSQLLPTPPTSDSFDRLHQQHNATPTHSPPEARPAAYGLRRSSPSVLSTQEQLPKLLRCSTFSPHTLHPPPPQQHNYHAPPSFPSAVMPPNMLHHWCSTAALSGHPYALTVHRPSATEADYPPPSGAPLGPGLSPLHAAPLRRRDIHVLISEGMDTPGSPNPFQSLSRCPNLAHRASVPALFHAPQHLSVSMPTISPTPTSAVPLQEEQQRDIFTP
jgi:hypothetical protein